MCDAFQKAFEGSFRADKLKINSIVKGMNNDVEIVEW